MQPANRIKSRSDIDFKTGGLRYFYTWLVKNHCPAEVETTQHEWHVRRIYVGIIATATQLLTVLKPVNKPLLAREQVIISHVKVTPFTKKKNKQKKH